MPNTSIPITHPVPAEVPPAHAPGIWYAFRAEMDRLFDRLASFLGWAPVSRAHFESTFDIAAPVVDITEDDSAFKLTAEFPGMTEKDIEVLLSGDTLPSGGKSARSERKNRKTTISLSVFMENSGAPFSYPKGWSARKSWRSLPTASLP